MSMLTCYCHQAGYCEVVGKYILHYLGDIEKGKEEVCVFF